MTLLFGEFSFNNTEEFVLRDCPRLTSLEFPFSSFFKGRKALISNLESLSHIVVSSMCFWKSSEDSADDHNDKECVYYNRSLELKDLPQLQSFLSDSYSFYRMSFIKLENLSSLKPENVIVSDSSFVGASSIMQSNADVLSNAITQRNEPV